MINRLSVDTGTPRSVMGHFVSGAVASSVLASALNYNRYKKDELCQQEAIKNTAKLTLQGGIATSSAIAAANYLGKGEILQMFSAISLGMMGIYGIEKLEEKTEQLLDNKKKEEQI